MTVEIHGLTIGNPKLVGDSRRPQSREAENVEGIVGSPQRCEDDAGGAGGGAVMVRRCREECDDQTEKEKEKCYAVHLSRAWSLHSVVRGRQAGPLDIIIRRGE